MGQSSRSLAIPQAILLFFEDSGQYPSGQCLIGESTIMLPAVWWTWAFEWLWTYPYVGKQDLKCYSNLPYFNICCDQLLYQQNTSWSWFDSIAENYLVVISPCDPYNSCLLPIVTLSLFLQCCWQNKSKLWWKLPSKTI